MTLTGTDWAQPVTAKRWVAPTLALDWLARITGHRSATLARAKHRTWAKACGLR